MRFPRFGLWCLGAVFALLASAGCVSAQTFSGGGISVTQGGIGASTATGSATTSVTGVSGTVATVKVVLQGVTFDTNGNDGNNFGLAGATFVLQAPSSGPELVLLGATGNGSDGTFSSPGINITIQDGNSAAPGGDSGTPWTGSATVEPSSYWMSFQAECPPTGSSGDYPQTDGSVCGGGNKTLDGKFAGTTADGTWTLTLVDTNGGNIAITGWQLTLTANA